MRERCARFVKRTLGVYRLVSRIIVRIIILLRQRLLRRAPNTSRMLSLKWARNQMRSCAVPKKLASETVRVIDDSSRNGTIMKSNWYWSHIDDSRLNLRRLNFWSLTETSACLPTEERVIATSELAVTSDDIVQEIVLECLLRHSQFAGASL